MATIDPAVAAILVESQQLGFLGPRPIAEVVAHARGFVRALDEFELVESVIDLGAGGGVPGLVIAHDRPDLRLTLLDRRAKRTDFLERVVRRLGWRDRVAVVCQDVSTFAPEQLFGAVVARGFGPPTFTLTAAAGLVRRGGPIVISEPPNEDRWDDKLLDRLQLRRLHGPPTPFTRNDAPRQTQPGTAGGQPLDGLVAVFTAS